MAVQRMRDAAEEDLAAKRMRLEGGLDGPSEADVLRLVAQRESLRQARRFAESDAIREELRTMGVELFDKEKEWRSRDGRRGTLFTAGPQACMLTDVEIQERISQREEARKTKDWAHADTLRDELRRSGVELDDKELVWRTNNGRTGTYSGAPPALPKQTLGMPAIRKLVAERERLRAGMDFEAADELRRQLAQLGVEIFDNERVWRSLDGQQGVIITGGFEVDCLLTDVEISYRVAQREDARSAKDFSQADAIREELRRQGVELLDAQRVWCTTDGRQGTYQGVSVQISTMGAGLYSQQPQAFATSATVGGGFSMGASQHAQLGVGITPGLTTLLPAAFRPAQPAHASLNATLEFLAEAGTPLVGQACGARLPASSVTNNPSPMTFSTASILAMVSGRERARDNHDWEAADAIRADLRVHGVDVWDKEKVWRANDGRNGSITRLV